MPSALLDDLNPAQRAAVLAGDGPILILAGAGSGKTRTITHRIAHLLSERKVDPGQVMAVTFTNKAAGEMRERIAGLLGERSRPPLVSTFHAACARILRREIAVLGYDANFTILDESDSMSLLRKIIEEAALANSPSVDTLRARIDQAKNEALFPEDLGSRADDQNAIAIAALYRLYQDRLREMNAVDFGDLLLMTYRLFERAPEALARWQARAAHLLIDEYQDTNRVQYLMVRALSARSGNLCVVGDEDQSIYRWRGADIRNILDFERDFPNARVFKLEQNYRSTRTILAAAGAVIRNNRERKPKELWTANAQGELVTYYTGLTERDEADYIAREIARLTGGGLRFADIVVFYRVNAQSRVLEEALVRRRIAYYVVGGVRFYDHREVRDLLAYLKVLANLKDAVSLHRAIATPPRGIGDKTVEAMLALAAREHVSLFEAMGRMEAVSAVSLRIAKIATGLAAWIRELAQRCADIPVRAILDEVISKSGFLSYLDGLADGASRRQNIEEMLSAASAFDAEGGTGRLADFLERIALVSDADQVSAQGGRVALMTLHTSKGLEYPAVFIAGMEEGLFPHSRSQESGEEIEEERRLCYVGMTRARQFLYLTNTLSRELYGVRQQSRASRFLAEIDGASLRRIAPERPGEPLRMPSAGGEPYVDYTDSQVDEGQGDGLRVGGRVNHPTFGPGILRRREGRGDAAKAWVDFGRAGVKLLVLKFAKLRPIAR